MYEELTTFAPGLHCFESREVPNGLGRRMTVLGLSGGRIAVHSAIDLDEPPRLDALGKVAYIIVGNRMHTVEAPVLAQRYPEAVVLAPPSIVAKLAKAGVAAHDVVTAWPAELTAELACIPVGGLRLDESVFVHRASRTLVLTDLAFNFSPADFTGLWRMGMNLNRGLGGFGPTRTFSLVFLSDRVALKASLAKIVEHDFDRVVVTHGKVLEAGGAETFRRAFAPFL